MRSAFAHALLDLAAQDERIVLLTGDLGFAVLEPFAERFPDRFWNAGVAEQNMVGLATGLAEAGHTPYVYSIATFASMRGYEFVRNGPILHELPVRVVGVGGGMDYGHNGVTHYALEDAGIMRVQPGISVVAPADPEQTRVALPAIQDLPGPVYLRLGKESTPVPGLDGRFALGRAERIGDGRDVALVAFGGMGSTAVEASQQLAAQGVDAAVHIVSSLSPAPTEDLAEALAEVPLAISVEAHYVNGAVGSLVAETIAEHALGTRLIRTGLRATPTGATGSRPYLYERHGLAPAQLAATAVEALANGASAPPVPAPVPTGATEPR
jgi:transketolase